MLYPLRFQPIVKQYLWGGTRLRDEFGKPAASAGPVAESWEIVDRRGKAGEPAEQSVVRFGPLVGTTLGELVERHGGELLGRHAPQPRFPLLMKLLDAEQPLSLQVHPNDEQAALLDPPDFGKTEAWVVLDAQPGAALYAGLKAGVTRTELERAIAAGRLVDCLRELHPRAGDCLYLPAGTVHALGAGLLIAEIQQSSDVTYRLHDWDRLGPDGRPRELHVAAGLDAIDFAAAPPELIRGSGERTRLATSDKFIWEQRSASAPIELGGDDRAHIVTVIEGEIAVAGDPAGEAIRLGETVLLPASLGSVRVAPRGKATLLDAYLP